MSTVYPRAKLAFVPGPQLRIVADRYRLTIVMTPWDATDPTPMYLTDDDGNILTDGTGNILTT